MYRPDDFSAGLGEFVPVVCLQDEVIPKLVEVVVELAAIRVTDTLAEVGERDGILVGRPEGTKDGNSSFVTEQPKSRSGAGSVSSASICPRKRRSFLWVCRTGVVRWYLDD